MEYGDTFTVKCDCDNTTVLDGHQNPVELSDLYEIIRRLQRLAPHYVYLVSKWFGNNTFGYSLEKIGVTDNPERRAKELGGDLYHLIECSLDDRIKVERVLQGYYIEKGKWEKDEWFQLEYEDIKFIKSLETVDDVLDRCETYLDWYFHPPSRAQIKAAYKHNREDPLSYWRSE